MGELTGLFNQIQTEKFIKQSFIYNLNKLDQLNSFTYTVKPRFTAPRLTANPDIPRPSPFPRIVLNMYNVNKQNPDLP